MDRIIVTCVALLILWFCGFSFYYRSQTDTRLNHAIEMSKNAPGPAFREMKPVWEYNNFQTLGKANTAKKKFLETLTHACCLRLQNDPANAMDFSNAQETLVVMKQMKQLGLENVEASQKQVLAAAREAVDGLRRSGTLSAWDAMFEFFVEIQDSQLIPNDAFPDADEWMQQLHKEPRRPLGIRDAINQATGQMNDALKSLGVDPAQSGGAMVASASDALDDAILIQAQRQFGQGLGCLDNFNNRFREPSPPELLPMRAVLQYDSAAIFAIHLIQRGAAAREQGTAFIADLLINPNTVDVPSTEEMYETFKNSTYGMLHGAVAIAQMTPLPEPDKQALVALGVRNEILLNRALNVETTEQEGRYQALLPQFTSAFGREALQKIQAKPNSALLILSVPGNPARPSTPAASN